MAFFNNKRKDFSIQPPKREISSIPFFVTDSANIDFTLLNNNLTANLTLTGVTAGIYGNAVNVPQITVDQWGRITNVTLVPISGGGGTYTVNNGLTENPANNFQLGGTLVQNTQINASTFYLELIGSITNALLRVYKSAAGYAIDASNTGGPNAVIRATGSTGPGVQGISTVSAGVTGTSTNSFGLSGSSTNSAGVYGTGLRGVLGAGNGNVGGEFSSVYTSNNNVQAVLNLIRNTSTSPSSNGVGANLRFWLQNDSDISIESHHVISKFIDVTTGASISQFEIWGRNSSLSRLLALTGPGQLILDKYGINTFAGTPAYALGVDATGNVVEFTPGGGGGVTSVVSGININVDNTNPAVPIINSLADRYKTTSVTSNSVSNGTKTFTVDANLSYIPLQEVLIVHNPSNHMHGEIVSYSGTTLIVDVKNNTGSGTYTSWDINLDGTPVDALTGTGLANEIAYFTSPQVLASLSVATYPNLTELSYVKGVTSSIQPQINSLKTTQIVTIFDGLGGVIQTGRGNNFLSIPFSGTITGWIILSSVTGSIEVAFWKDTYANYPPTVADNVFSPNPSLSAANKNQATGLSIPVTAGDIIIPNVVSVATCTNVVIAIQITKS